MHYEDYITQRNDLLTQAREAANAGNTEQFNSLRTQIEDLDTKYEAAQVNQANLRALENGAATPPVAQQLAGTPAAGAAASGTQDRTEDPYDSLAYSQAFMNFVCRGTEIPEQFRNQAQSTQTTDAGAVIPTTIMKEIVKGIRESGIIFKSVRHLNIRGGVQIPILDLKPEAHWIGEAKPSEDQKIQANKKISFSYYGLECKISRSILVSVVSLDEFNALFVELATEAVLVALDKAIFNGTGTSQPLGVTKDERVTNVVTPTAEEFASWDAWHKKIIAKIPKGYRRGNWYMAQSTFDGYIDGMTDKQGQPVGRTTYGITEGAKYSFAGRPVMTVEDDVIAPYDTASSTDVVAVYMNPKDYIINSNMQMHVVEWVDHDSNQKKSKVILICDGKIADAAGVLLVKKHA